MINGQVSIEAKKVLNIYVYNRISNFINNSFIELHTSTDIHNRLGESYTSQ